ncbi:MAG: 3-hydroxyacyl-CoA dehydrogenase NAD-binding domain-containing protein [Planctomycetota bacterium]
MMAAGIFMFARKMVADKAGKMVAPMKALECVEVGVKEGYEKGLAKELDNFIELALGEQALAMIHFFFAMRGTTRIPDLKNHQNEAKPIAKVGVVGGGTMGRDIAFVHLLSGKTVTLLEADQQRLDAAVEAIKGHFSRRVDRKKMTPEKMQNTLAKFKPTLNYEDFRDVDLVIEAVFEKMEVKKEVFKKLAPVVRRDAVLASNTSTLPIAELASVVEGPERVIGLHFFSPARVMPLLEEIRTSQTSPATVVTCLNLAKDIKKTPVLVGDCYGFLTNRIAMSYGSEANAILQEGASVEQIDKAIKEFGLPMGPFTMGDMAGNDIGYHAAPGMMKAYPERSRPLPAFAEKMFQAGRHGQKAGKGFYLYKSGSSEGMRDPEFEKILAESRKEAGITPRTDITDQEIVERIMYTWVNAAALCLEEGIALKASDVDVATVMGFGFPVWRGGLMHYAEKTGWRKVVSALDGYAKKYGPIYAPAQWLRDQASKVSA